MLPEGWKRVPLGEIAQITSGGTPDRAQPAYWGGDIPWVTTGEIHFNSISDTAEKITEAGLKNSAAKVFPPGTLLLAMYGQGKTRGQVAKLAISAATNQACAAILLKNDHDPEFYFQTLASQYEEIREFGNAGTQKNLNGGLIKELVVPLPPLLEQQRISEVVGTWDAAIATIEKLLANSRRQKQILAIRLFRAKAHWVNTAFGEIFEISNQKAAQVATSAYLASGQVPIVDQGQELIAGYTDDSSICVEPPVIVFGDHTRMVKWVGFRFRPGADGTQLLRPVADIHPKFAYHLLANAPIQNLGYSRHMSILKALNFLVPPNQAEQSSIADQMDLADEVIAVISVQIEKLKAEKRALMQQLLTGKRRVRLPATEAARA